MATRSRCCKGEPKMKKLFAIILSAVMLFSFAACTPQNTNTPSGDGYVPVDINVAAIKGPTGVGMVDLMQKQEDGTAANNYTFSLHTNPQEVIGLISNKDADIAAVPTNVAANLYKKTNGGIKVLAVNTYGVLHLLENGNSVNSIEDLRGKTVWSTGQGSNPEYVLRFVLESNGIDPDTDVTIRFASNNDEIVAQMRNAGTIGVVPEPAATTVISKFPTIRRVAAMDTEWEKLTTDSALMMGCVVVRTEFLEANPEAVAKFMEEYKASIGALSDNDRIAELCEKFEIIANKEIAKNAIPNCHVAFVEGENMKSKLSGYFQVLYNANPASIGGALPDDNFYYIQK